MTNKNQYFQHNDGPSSILSPDRSHSSLITKWYCKIGNWFRMLIIAILCALIVLAIIYNEITVELFTSFIEWKSENIWLGSVAFVFIYTLCTVVMIPGSILTLGAGFVYVDLLGTLIGVLSATTIVWISASIGATLSFINGRYLLRKCVVSYAAKHDKFEIIETIVKEYGFSVTFWLRLSSITPYNVFNYFMGLTSVKLTDYMLAHTGMIPDIAVYCFIGGSISELIEIAETGIGDNVAFIVVLVVTLIISIIGMITISYYAKKKFDKMAQEIKDRRVESDRFDLFDDDGIMSEMVISSNDTREYLNV